MKTGCCIAVTSDRTTLGYLLHMDAEKVVAKVTNVEYGLATGFPLIDSIWRQGWAPGWLVVPAAPPKRYKCLGKCTKVLMFDRSVKPVEDILVGDLIMGDDLLPRKVLTCGQGVGQLYRVKQATCLAFRRNASRVPRPAVSIRAVTTAILFDDILKALAGAGNDPSNILQDILKTVHACMGVPQHVLTGSPDKPADVLKIRMPGGILRPPSRRVRETNTSLAESTTKRRPGTPPRWPEILAEVSCFPTPGDHEEFYHQ